MARSEFTVRDYDLAATLSSGQAFRWRRAGDAWEGVIHGRWVRLRQFSPPLPARAKTDSLDIQWSLTPRFSIIEATITEPQTDCRWLAGYLRLDDDFSAMLATFPDDEPLRAAITHCRGLRLLRQEPWECLASFILSSTKQIVHIRQCVAHLCERFGARVASPKSDAPQFAFPTAARLAAAGESELRECKIGFRAKYLHAAARMVSSGELDLARVQTLPLPSARAELMRCPGVGRKIADCALLFSCGFEAAFPIDVWVERALRQLYFPKRRVNRARLEHFSATHFGPHAGLAQQYLFHYLRTRNTPSSK